jgi:hypothetical protein
MLIYKTFSGLTPPYLRYLLQHSSSTYNTHSASNILLKVPKAHTSLGCPCFQFTVTSNWNKLQKTLKLNSLTPALHSKTQSCKLLLTLVAASRDVLLSIPFCPLCCCLCLIMFVPCLCCYHVVLLPCCVTTGLLSCCVATMLCCHVLLPCCVVVLGLSLYSVVVSVLSWCVFCPTF